MTDSDDRVDRALRLLREERMPSNQSAEAAANSIFDRHVAARPRRHGFRRFAAAAVIIALFGTVVGGVATRWYYLDVIEIERGTDGRPETMRLRIDESSEALLVPLSGPTMSDQSGEVHMVAARDERGLPLMLEITGMIPGVTTSAFEAVNVEGDPTPGQRLEVRPLPPPQLTLVETATGARLLISRNARNESTIALTAIPDRPNSLTDGLVVIRVIRP